MPRRGYTDLVERILAHPSIAVSLGTRLDPSAAREYRHLFWSGPLDAFFDYSLGRLPYRTLEFEPVRADGDFQGCAVMNYCERSVPYTRVAEHKHFSPWEQHDRTICFREYSRACGPGDTPFYPVRLAQQELLLQRYSALACATRGVSFVGRLGTYRYLDMDVSVGEALSAAERFVECERAGAPVPQFFNDPVAH
jgi:UDP-galactopyranose mutase